MAHSVGKANLGGHDNIDRIRDLPGHVIDYILSHLPIRDIVRTSILSWEWKYMWVSVPQLVFGFDFFNDLIDKGIGDQIPSIITDILLLHNGPVSKFTLQIPDRVSIKLTCLYKWIFFLSKRGIEDLQLVCQQSEIQKLPSQLFYCNGLKYLNLFFIELSLPPPGFCGFESLLDLQLFHVEFEFGTLERLISTCPILESLTIIDCDGCDDCISVSSPRLKVLCIDDNRYIKSFCFKKAKNLVDLTLTRQTQWPIIIFPHLMTSLKYLKLEGVDFGSPKELLFMASLLKSSPNLVELVLSSYYWNVGLPVLPYHQRSYYYNSCCLSQLQKVDITVGDGYEHALDLTRFLLENSPSLEILTFDLWLGPEYYEEFNSISHDLLQVRRASPRAEVKFLSH